MALISLDGICILMQTLVSMLIVAVVLKFIDIYNKSRKVDMNSVRHGGELVAEVLEKHSVKQIFTLVGGHISPILAACEKVKIKIVDTRHEASAVFAADAVARLTGEIGVAAVTAGPGLTNTVTAVKNAQIAESPVLLMGGAAATILKGKGALQDIDQMTLFKSICKYCITIKRVKDIVPVLKKAISIALSGVPGPVFVEFPIDVLYPYHVVRKEMLGRKHTSSSMFNRIVNWYLEYYLSSVFTSAWEPRDPSPLPVNTPMPSEHLVKKVAELLAKSKNPVFVVGSQAMLLHSKVEELQQALEKIGVPTYLGGMARGLLGAHSPFQFRHGRKEVLKNADFILLAGAVCDFRLSYGQYLSKKSKIVTVNRDYKRATQNAGTFWKPAITVVGDVASFIIKLGAEMEDYQCSSSWILKLRQKETKKEKENFQLSRLLYERYHNPLNVLHELEKYLPDNSILIGDGGDFVGTAAYILRPRGPYCWMDPGAFGTLGVGGGFALGAKLAFPSKDVWILYGDGACGYSIAEFDSLARHNLNVMAIVGNDAGWTQIEREQKPLFGTSVACALNYTDYHDVASGFGARGLLCKDQEVPLLATFEAAKALYSEGRSVLINVLINKSSFRDGSISV